MTRIFDDLNEFKNNCWGKPLIGLDLGEKTIWIAIANADWHLSTPLTTLTKSKFSEDLNHLLAIIDQRQIGGVIIGLPLMMDGKINKRAQSCISFGQNLRRNPNWHVPVAYWDERLSTEAMRRSLIKELDQTRTRQAKLIDQLAASFILQGALDYFKYSSGNI